MHSRLRPLPAASVMLALLAPAPAHAAAPTVTVMSRNLYLGADIITAATAKDVPELQQRATTLFQTVQQTNFPVRAKAIAKEIATTRPDLVGLQEVADWRRTADGVTGRHDASIVVYDYLALLTKELKARHLSYRPAIVQTELDLEVPTSQNYDVRLTMRDVILVRSGKGAKVKIRRTLKGHYKDLLKVNLPTGPVTSTRGWAAIDATVGGRAFRFVDTHLEAYGGAIRGQQAKELVAGPLASRKRQAILVGDLNSAPTDTGDDALALKNVKAAGFVDAFKKAPKTDGEDEKLDNATPTLKRYIDHIMSRPTLRTVSTRVVGNRTSDRIGGLWPSDHAGTVATLRL